MQLNEGQYFVRTVCCHLAKERIAFATSCIYIKDVAFNAFATLCIYIQDVAFNVTHFESRITHLLYTAINTTEHGQVRQCLGFTKSLTSSIQRLGDVLHDNQGIAPISQVHLP